MPSYTRLKSAALVLANVLLPVAILTFASGFFPYKPVLPGLNTFEHVDTMGQKRPDAIFDRVIFMVVDALRSDFVYSHGSGFEFTQSLIRSGFAIPFTAHATPPTVTMPRVKALTTGSVPSFADLILNIAESDTSSSLALQDTWLAQVRARNKGAVVFYGDDTWLKLFPSSANSSFFSRADGTSSFFVSDFTEVDLNVTRHLPSELLRDDWDAMILHYLGLDHIGHKTGPQGPNMLPKQREMDSVVRSIYEAMEKETHQRNTLLVLAGDHGMNAGGNHGGSGPGETEPALLFASPKFSQMQRQKKYECPTAPKEGTEFHYYTKVQQSDLVPTLAGLMGFPISRNSLGVFIPELAGFWNAEESVGLFQQNARQVRQIIEAMYGKEIFLSAASDYRTACSSTGNSNICKDSSEGLQRLACLWALASQADQEPSTSYSHTLDFLLEAQNALSGTASSYNIPRMVSGMVLSSASLLLALSSFPSLWPPGTSGLWFSFISLLYGIMMFASSYVEEEQHLWYWLTPAWIILLTTTSSHFALASYRRRLGIGLAAFAILAVHRFAVRWNQTGQKHAGAPDIVHTFFPRAHIVLWLLILLTYSYTGILLIRRTFAGIIAQELAALVAIVMIVPAVVFKLNFTQADAPELVQGLAAKIRMLSEPFDLVSQAQFAFATLTVAAIAVVVLSLLSAQASKNAGLRERGQLPSLAERLHVPLTLFLMMQTRTANIPLFLGFEIQRQALVYILMHPKKSDFERRSIADAMAPPVMQIATSILLLSHVYFFCMGGSNSISSIDLSNAYNGVAEYNVVAVGVLLFASNWVGPIWWCSTAALLLATYQPSQPELQAAHGNEKRQWVVDERAKLREETLRARMSAEASSQIDSPAAEARAWTAYLSCMTAFVATSLIAVMAACTALRTHLFIWTVFSPKYLYAMAWSLGWHLIVNIAFGSLVRRLDRIR